jgi:hypothetical protein
MRNLIVSALSLTALLATGADAQDRFAVIPYAGYMVFGDILEGPLGTSLSNTNGSIVGAQLSMPVAGPLALYINGGLAQSDLSVGLPLLGGISVGSSDAWLFDGGLELRVPASGRLRPVLQAGAGATRYSMRNSLIRTESTNAMGTLGLGVDLAIAPSAGLRLMVRDHIGRFDFREAVFADIQGRTSHHVGLTAGLRLSF